MNPKGPVGSKPCILPEFDSQTVDYMCRQLCNEYLLEANVLIGLILGCLNAHNSHTLHETMQLVSFSCAPAKIQTVVLFRGFPVTSLVILTWGF